MGKGSYYNNGTRKNRGRSPYRIRLETNLINQTTRTLNQTSHRTE
jgi:hypothetical protein